MECNSRACENFPAPDNRKEKAVDWELGHSCTKKGFSCLFPNNFIYSHGRGEGNTLAFV
jgi:hypothetical protein